MSIDLCPHCGKAPEVFQPARISHHVVAHCVPCNWPVRETENEHGHTQELYGATGQTNEEALDEWSSRVADYLGDEDELVLLEQIAECDREIDGGHAEPERLRALGRLLRAELTARHGDAIETVVDHVLGSSTYARRITREEAIEIAEGSPQLVEMVALFGADRVVDVVVRGVARRLCGAA